MLSFCYPVFRKSADDILDTARRVIELLDEAKEAQDVAEEAITTANTDIADAEGDLAMVSFRNSENMYEFTHVATKETEKIDAELDLIINGWYLHQQKNLIWETFYEVLCRSNV